MEKKTNKQTKRERNKPLVVAVEPRRLPLFLWRVAENKSLSYNNLSNISEMQWV